MSNRSDAAALRHAARRLEKLWPSTPYPCFAVSHFAAGSYLVRGDLPSRFIMAMAPGKQEPLNGLQASDKYLGTPGHVNIDAELGRDHSILALCFAAAMAETGDLP